MFILDADLVPYFGPTSAPRFFCLAKLNQDISLGILRRTEKMSPICWRREPARADLFEGQAGMNDDAAVEAFACC